MDNLIYFITCVKNHPKLFNNEGNSDEQDDTKEWAAVAEECKMSITDAQAQWNQLLVEYVGYLRNSQDFYLAKHMDFLQPYFFTIIDRGNIDEDELLNAIDSKKIDEMNILESKEELEQKKDNSFQKEAMENEKKIIIEQQTEDMELLATSITSNQNAQTKISKDINITSSNTPHYNTSFTNLTSLELIFLGYAKQLQKMPLPLQLKTKRKIADIMDEAEVELLSCLQPL